MENATETKNAGLMMISTNLPAEQVSELDRIAKRTFSNRSVLLRQAVAQYLEVQGRKEQTNEQH